MHGPDRSREYLASKGYAIVVSAKRAEKTANEAESAPVLRDSSGRFLPGRRGGPGRPPGCIVKYRDIFRQTLGEEHVRELIESLYRRAMKGNIPAAKLIIEQVCGRPRQQIDLGIAAENSEGIWTFFGPPAAISQPSPPQPIRADSLARANGHAIAARVDLSEPAE